MIAPKNRRAERKYRLRLEHKRRLFSKNSNIRRKGRLERRCFSHGGLSWVVWEDQCEAREEEIKRQSGRQGHTSELRPTQKRFSSKMTFY